MRDFDSFGTNDNDRVRAMNAYHQAHGGGILEPVKLPARQVTHNVPVQVWSGMKLEAAGGGRASEFSRSTVMAFNGSGSQFVFAAPQTNQGYPSDGSPRDVSIRGIQFQGPASTDWWQCFDPSKDSYTGRVLWSSEIYGCSWKAFRRVYWGWWDGVTVSGVTHCQGITDTSWHVAGAENVLYSGEQSVMDNTGWANTPKPHIRSRMEKSRIGVVMPTARGISYQLAVDGGRNLQVLGLQCDSQDSDPVSGANIRVNGGENITITGCSFKGGADDLPAAQEHGIIEVAGGNHVNITGNDFTRRGTRAPASTPLVFAGPNVFVGGVIVGPNNYAGYDGVLRQSKAGQIVCTDPRMKVVTQP
jgi:hypothetical protein